VGEAGFFTDSLAAVPHRLSEASSLVLRGANRHAGAGNRRNPGPFTQARRPR